MNMTPELEALGRRAIRCKGWRWIPGMRLVTGDHPSERWRGMGEEGDDDGPWFVSDEGDAYGWEDKSAPLALIFDPLPDLSDPATIGCLLALVRDAWDEPAATIDNGLNYAQERWWWVRSDFAQFAAGQTEAEALVSAMEAAP